MKTHLIIKLIVVSIFFLSACKSSYQQRYETNDRFLFVVVKNEPGVVAGLLSSCSCLQIIRMEVVHTESMIVDFTGSRTLPLETIQLIIKIKQEGKIIQLKDQLAEMQNVISIELK